MSVRRARLRSMWIAVGGVWIHSKVSADPVPIQGPTVVLVHGLGVSSWYLIPTAELLAPESLVYAPDLPGFGWSTKPKRVLDVPGLADALAAWTQAFGLERAAFLGNSLGCQILADFASRYPERVDSLVLQGPTVDRQHRTVPRQLAAWLQAAMREDPSLVFPILADFSRCGVPRLVETIQHTLRDRIEAKLPRVQAPTLVVRGTRDSLCDRQWAEEITRLLPQGQLVEIPGGGHAMVYSMPLELVRVSRPFFDKARTAARTSNERGPVRSSSSPNRDRIPNRLDI